MTTETFLRSVDALVELRLPTAVFAMIVRALAPVLLPIGEAMPEHKNRKGDTSKGQWRTNAARKGVATRRRRKKALRSAATLKPVKPRSKDARLQPVIGLLREKAAERSSHAMTDLERECRLRNIDAGLLDEAVHHLGGHLHRNGGNVLHAELPPSA